MWKYPRAPIESLAEASTISAAARASSFTSATTRTPSARLIGMVGERMARAGSRRRSQPAPAVARQQLVGLRRAEAAGRVVREVARRKRLPHVEERLHHAPGR